MEIAPIAPMRAAVLYEAAPEAGPGASFAALLDGASAALRKADVSAELVAAGGGDIAGAALARAKADVALEVAAITASRVSGAVSTLLQTQV